MIRSPDRTKHGSTSKGDFPADRLSLGAQKRDSKTAQIPGHVTAQSQEPRACTLSTISTSNVTPRSHQRRWSADFCKCGTSPVITVRKNKKEPQPPQRDVSLSQPNTASRHYPSTKRYSCPPIGVFRSPSQPSSSSSTSSTSSCSSPPPVQTSVITGPDPLGWKLRPRSSSASSRARTNRLSLQIPLPVVSPEPKSSPPPDNTPTTDPSPRSKPPLMPKPPRRHHSDSSAFLNPQPVVTLKELRNVNLRLVSLSDESDDVFSEEEVTVTTGGCKIPPPVPEKTAMARQIAQLIAHSRQRCKANEENIYSRVRKPKATRSHQTENNSNLYPRKTAGLRLDTSGDRERSTPRFPG